MRALFPAFALLAAAFGPAPQAPSADPAAAARAYLAGGVWRGGAGQQACRPDGNFQAFSFLRPASVEVGQGAPGSGQGERLELVSVSRTRDLLTIETRVCAPVGCNQTIEQYRVLAQDRMQEWSFEGRLPNQTPLILVRDGRSVTDGAPGRQFQRCRG